MVAFMSAASLLNNALTIVSGLLVAKWLLPQELGLFNSFSVLTSYIILVQLGIPSGLSRQLPFYFGKNEQQKALTCAASANQWGLLTGISCMIVSLPVAIFFFSAGNYTVAAGVIVVGITSFQGLYVTKYLKILYRSNNDFNRLTTIDIINAVVAFLSIFFVWKYKFYGLCIRAVIAVVIDLSFTYYWRPVKVRRQWNKAEFNELMKIGFPIYWVANIYSLWPMVQRTVIVSMGGTKALGLFSLAAIVETAMKTLTNAISSVSFPRMAFAWGQKEDFMHLLTIPFKPVLVSAAANTVVAVAGWFLLPFLIKSLLPNYVEATAAAQWMLWVGWMASFSVFSNVYMIIQKNMDRLWSYVAGVAAWLICSFVLNKVMGFNLIIFPLATMVGFVFIYAVDVINFRRYYLYYSKIRSGNPTI